MNTLFVWFMVVHLHGGGITVTPVDGLYACILRQQFEERFDPRARVQCTFGTRTEA